MKNGTNELDAWLAREREVRERLAAGVARRVRPRDHHCLMFQLPAAGDSRPA